MNTAHEFIQRYSFSGPSVQFLTTFIPAKSIFERVHAPDAHMRGLKSHAHLLAFGPSVPKRARFLTDGQDTRYPACFVQNRRVVERPVPLQELTLRIKWSRQTVAPAGFTLGENLINERLDEWPGFGPAGLSRLSQRHGVFARPA